MVTGITPQEAIKLYGHAGATKFNEHVRMLKKTGHDVTDFVKVDNRKKYDLPETCMIRLCRSGKRTGHLVVHHKGKFYDPAKDNGVFNSKEELLERYPDKWRIEYYLEIKGKNNNVDIKEMAKEAEIAMVAGEKRLKVTVSHDIFNKGKRHFITKVVTERQLENLKQQPTFKIEKVEKA